MQDPRRLMTLAATVLVCLVCVVFWPIVGFEFVNLDVGQHVIENRHIQGLTIENLKHIFSSRCFLNYYPVRSLTFAVDYQLWGLDAGAFKFTNGVIHSANVFLVFWLVIRLFRHPASTDRSPRSWNVCVATLSASVFAVHPVVVEPVAWVAGREELLMTLGALGCIHFHVTGRRLSEEGGRTGAALACYAGAVFCCAAACLSNAVAAVIPLLIVAWDTLTLARPRFWRIVCGSSVLWIISAVTIVIKKIGPDRELVAVEPGMFSAERAMLALNVYWLNLKTLIWPTRLSVEYSKVTPQVFWEGEVILGGVAFALTCLILWRLRRRNLLLLGLVWFGLALAPASQIMPHHVHRADRFLYLPLAGLAVAVAVALKTLGSRLNRRAAVTGATAAGVLGLLLSVVLSARQVRTWRDSLSMWEHSVMVNPNNATAHDALANVLRTRGELDRAMQHFRKAMELDFDDEEVLHILAQQYATGVDERWRNYGEAIRLAQRACELSQWKEPRYLHGLAVVHSSFAASLANAGEVGPAIENFNNAIKADPSYDLPYYNLALLLATCEDERLRRPEEAVRLAERACRVNEHPDAEQLRILAEVYAEAGRLDQAVTTAERAARLAESTDRPELAERLWRCVQSFRQRLPSGTSRNGGDRLND